MEKNGCLRPASSVVGLAHGIQLCLNVLGNLCLQPGPKHVIDSQDGAGRFGRAVDRGTDDAQWFKHADVAQVRGNTSSEVETDPMGCIAAFRLGSGDVQERIDWVVSCVFSKRTRDDLDGIRVGFHRQLLAARCCFSKAAKVPGQGHMSSPSADQQAPVEPELGGDADGIVEAA